MGCERGRGKVFSNMVAAGIIPLGEQTWSVGHEPNVNLIVNKDGK